MILSSAKHCLNDQDTGTKEANSNGAGGQLNKTMTNF
jgi:hypothetical protein